MQNSIVPFPAVGAYIQNTIDQVCDISALRAPLIEILSRPGRVLSRQGPAKWPAFVLDIADALDGDPDSAVIAAALVEFTIAATDVVDDLVDDEWDGAVDSVRALNASLALSWLAQRCVSDLAERLTPERALRVGGIVARGVIDACAGEDLDLAFEAISNVTEEMAYEMTARKAGSLVALACQVGAALAIDDGSVIEQFGVLGRDVGIVAQLLNDIGGVSATSSDIPRRKKTLPVVYALCCAQDEGIDEVLEWYREDRSSASLTAAQLAEAIRDLGGLHYTWVIAEVHRGRAMTTLQTLSAMVGSDMAGLRHLIASLNVLDMPA